MFLEKLCAVEYFYSSDIVQLFISEPVDFIKHTSSYKIPSYTIIAENFESNFKGGLDYELHQDSIGNLLEIKVTYANAIILLENFEQTFIENAKNVKEYKIATGNILIDIQDTYKWLNPDQGENTPTFDDVEPYTNLINWTLDQIQDFSAVIEAISRIETLIKVKEITQNGIINASIEIQKLAVGKKSLLAIVNRKSTGELLKNKQQLLDELNAQLKAIDIIIPVVASKLLNIDIPYIKTKNITSFDKEIKKFAELAIKDFEGIRRQLLLSD